MCNYIQGPFGAENIAVRSTVARLHARVHSRDTTVVMEYEYGFSDGFPWFVGWTKHPNRWCIQEDQGELPHCRPAGNKMSSKDENLSCPDLSHAFARAGLGQVPGCSEHWG